MGRGMAENLIKAGHDVTVYNRTRSKAEEMAALGAKVADTPAAAAAGNEVVITILADPPAVDEAVLGENGVIEGLASGAVLIDCSTVDPATSSATRKAAEAKGARFIDCPVAGSKDHAASGELVLMVGGDKETFDEVRDVFDAVAKRVIHAGPAGSGTALKLCFNIGVSHTVVALAEALVLGTKSGLDPQIIIDTFMAGTIGSRFFEWKGGCIADRDFATNFSTKLMHKDLGLIMSSGQSNGVPLPVTAAVKELFQMAKGHGQSEEDFCSVVKVLEDLADVEVRRTR